MKMERIKKSKTFLYMAVFGALIVLFVLLLTAAYAIPNAAIAPRQQASAAMLEREGNYPRPFFGVWASTLDNFTDALMIDKALIDTPEHNPLEAAMYNNDYARYWHGYQIFLRPLLMVFSYQQIRYLHQFVFFILFCLAFSQIHKRAGLKPALAFLLAMCGCYLVLIPASLQFTSVFVIMLSALIYLVPRCGTPREKNLPLVFMVIGMLTVFFDLLTAPLLTLGIPLLAALYLKISSQKETAWLTRFKELAFCGLAWTAGYGGCWAVKWLLASAVLRKNVVANAVETILFRTGGNEQYPIHRLATLRNNFNNLFAAQGKGVFLLWILLLAGLLLLLLFFHKSKREIGHAALLLLVAAAPYVWYLVLSNHSGIHAWFTFRAQAVTVFGVCLFFIAATDWERGKSWLKRRFPFKKQ